MVRISDGVFFVCVCKIPSFVGAMYFVTNAKVCTMMIEVSS